ncbi:hypothetical protein [Candidatus Manganitrophus noduliformans]|uniref:Peptidase M41 domain-containing protein n=1 Tax=Candidatus Manganitrophus noduliformans TaxID=2606439 RepID=A0A7X6IAZ9_9BACT|nr:hypothetical protein [Candidatus Manganitrophus noduliformans]NKE71246.1 hypothetical protein [Candidatus Manganitrophus noduliformans]
MKSTSKSKLKKLERTAYHEAGHAAASYLLGRRICRVSIVPDYKNGSLGHSAGHRLRNFHPDYDESDKTRLKVEREIMILMAGEEAEWFYSGRRNKEGARSDRHEVFKLMGYIDDDPDSWRLYCKWLRIRTRRLVINHIRWKVAIPAVAHALLSKNKMTGAEVAEAIQAAIQKEIAASVEAKAGPIVRRF